MKYTFYQTNAFSLLRLLLFVYTNNVVITLKIIKCIMTHDKNERFVMFLTNRETL